MQDDHTRQPNATYAATSSPTATAAAASASAGKNFCYYHHTTRKPVANPRQRRKPPLHLRAPPPRRPLRHPASIGKILQRIASNDIDPRRAGLLLYGLQIASLNLPKQPPRNPQRQRGNPNPNRWKRSPPTPN